MTSIRERSPFENNKLVQLIQEMNLHHHQVGVTSTNSILTSRVPVGHLRNLYFLLTVWCRIEPMFSLYIRQGLGPRRVTITQAQHINQMVLFNDQMN